MKKIIVMSMLLLAPLASQADLNVFTCEPEWSALAGVIGGDKVKTSSATNALQDPHYIQARPSLISKVRRADLIVCSGAQLEIGWLPMLLRKGNNPDVLPGSEGFLEASMYVKRLDIAVSSDRSQGDVHPQGNPHIQTNPHNILLVAKAMTERMARLDPGNAKDYQQRLLDFSHNWSNAIVAWEKRAADLRGKRVIAHHKSWIYLQDWLGLEEVATLEPVSGVPPTATHLADLLNRFGGDGNDADFIIRAPFQSAKSSIWLSERTGIPAVLLPLTVGGTDQATDLYKWFDDMLNRLLGSGGS
ncbi:MAG: zinc ABC transporter solute-binding protein [Gammaproteobacteria bacterium]|nr:zinc ABC transporter solute-binding protein [Gammaproteobacteria bacterium]